ncbi:exostosin [Paramecium bursaria Chlorella virus AN69C]|uniref:Exostosin n=1 Tax=Paramecium bursaria Chlorella virus IL3A TaxID=46019 RepID=M1I5J5_PBCVI|nr:exostosin [Paramecium bursaria Chlorella virus AN69C]AGE53755.1 exostosin [Paramecium bursaria Chlorella virus IL3A]
MKLAELTLESDDFITSDKLFNFCKRITGATYVKTDFIKFRQYQYIVSNCGWRNDTDVVFLENTPVLVTGHSDYDISERELDIIRLPNIKAFFCQNRNIQHPKVISFPLGITNKDEPNSEIHRIIGNTDRILEVSKTSKEIKNLVYMNISVKNFPEERQKIVDLYSDKPWVTVGKCEITEKGHRKFLEDIYSHKFCFAPRGNGIDTHRLWESLYLRTIPIVKKHIAMEQFTDLPILFVDDWENITEEFLNEQYEIIMNKDYNLDKLKIDYWYQQILKYSQ